MARAMPVLPLVASMMRIAGADIAARLCLGDHAQGRAVLHRAGGVVALELGQHRVAAVAGQALQPHQRRAADTGFDRRVVGHAFSCVLVRGTRCAGRAIGEPATLCQQHGECHRVGALVRQAEKHAAEPPRRAASAWRGATGTPAAAGVRSDLHVLPAQLHPIPTPRHLAIASLAAKRLARKRQGSRSARQRSLLRGREDAPAETFAVALPDSLHARHLDNIRANRRSCASSPAPHLPAAREQARACAAAGAEVRVQQRLPGAAQRAAPPRTRRVRYGQQVLPAKQPSGPPRPTTGTQPSPAPAGMRLRVQASPLAPRSAGRPRSPAPRAA
jgi:hypothetical protein